MAKKNKDANGVLKKKDLFRFHAGLEAVGEYRGIKFAYAVVKTLRLVDTEVANLKKSNAWSDAFKEFEKEREVLVKQYAKKDKDGNPKTVQTGNKIGIEIENGEAYNSGLGKLEKKHAKAVKEQKEKDAEYEKFLEEPAEVKVHTVPESVLPKDISAKHLEGIFEIVA